MQSNKKYKKLRAKDKIPQSKRQKDGRAEAIKNFLVYFQKPYKVLCKEIPSRKKNASRCVASKYLKNGTGSKRIKQKDKEVKAKYARHQK